MAQLFTSLKESSLKKRLLHLTPFFHAFWLRIDKLGVWLGVFSFFSFVTLKLMFAISYWNERT